MARTKTRSVTVVRQANVVRRRYQSRGRFGSHKLSLGILIGAAPGIAWSSEPITQGRTVNESMQRLVAAYTGYSYGEKRWDAFYLQKGLLPLVGGFFLHYLADAVGINRAISKLRLPVQI